MMYANLQTSEMTSKGESDSMTIKNIKTLVVSMVIGAMLLATVGAFAQDDNVLTPKMLTNDATVTDSLTSTEQSRLYAFNGTAGDIVTITMIQRSEELDPLVVLLGPDGTVIGSDDDSGEVPLSAKISRAELPLDGTYFVLASSWEYIDVLLDLTELPADLEYDLKITGVTASTDMLVSYEAQGIESGSVVEGMIDANKPVAYFTFTGNAGDVINLTMASDDFDTILHVFDQKGARIAVNDDVSDIDINSAITNFELPSDGRYLVFATNLFFYQVLETIDALSETDLEFIGGAYTLSLE